MKQDNRLPFPSIKYSLQYFPSIYPKVFSVLSHIFTVNGNGYDLDKHGNLVAWKSKKKKSITDDGIKGLRYNVLGCSHFCVYPINSYEYELKAWGGDHFFTDLYSYPKMNAEWQRAARWFLWQLLGRDSKWWARHYRAIELNPATRKYPGAPNFVKEKLARIKTARKHFAAFVKQQGIVLHESEAMQWESDLINYLSGQPGKVIS